MKTQILALSLIALLSSGCATTQTNENDYLHRLGLTGFGAALGDGHSSFGVHYHHDGYYDYHGTRYYDRSVYLQAVEQYERRQQLTQRYINYSKYYRGYNPRYSSPRYSSRGYNSRLFIQRSRIPFRSYRSSRFRHRYR